MNREHATGNNVSVCPHTLTAKPALWSLEPQKTPETHSLLKLRPLFRCLCLIMHTFAYLMHAQVVVTYDLQSLGQTLGFIFCTSPRSVGVRNTLKRTHVAHHQDLTHRITGLISHTRSVMTRLVELVSMHSSYENAHILQPGGGNDVKMHTLCNPCGGNDVKMHTFCNPGGGNYVKMHTFLSPGDQTR